LVAVSLSRRSLRTLLIAAALFVLALAANTGRALASSHKPQNGPSCLSPSSNNSSQQTIVSGNRLVWNQGNLYVFDPSFTTLLSFVAYRPAPT